MYVSKNKHNVSALTLSTKNVSALTLLNKNVSALTKMIGQKIKEARKAKKMTLKQLGAKIERTHSALSQIENGIYQPEKPLLIALAKILESNFGELWLNEYVVTNNSLNAKQEIIEETSLEEFVSLKFGGKNTLRSKAEAEKLRRLLDAEIERMKKEEELYGE